MITEVYEIVGVNELGNVWAYRSGVYACKEKARKVLNETALENQFVDEKPVKWVIIVKKFFSE
jgi:hypothetical protein